MSQSLKSLGIDKLSVSERILLVQEIWDSIVGDEAAVDVPQSHKDELDRRLAAYDADPRAGPSWDEVKARLQGGP